MGRKYREYSYDDWKKAMELLEKGYGLAETCRILGWSETKKSTLYRWKHGIIPPSAKWKAEPSNELAYAIGTIHGDGSVCKFKKKFWYEYVIQLAVIDKEFAETFSRAMSRLLGINYHKPRWNEKEKEWRVVYQSKAFYKWYKRCKEQGLQGFKEYIEYNIETVRYYLKGLFDSDGSNKRNKRIFLYNSNKELLEYIQHLLKKYFDVKATGPYLVYKAGDTITINGVKIHYNDDYYHISINKREHVQKFLEEIGFSIIRKQLRLKKYERVFVEGIGYMEPYELVKLGLFKLPFSDTQ